MSANKTRLTPVKLDNNTIIYIEAQDSIEQGNLNQGSEQKIPEEEPKILSPEEAGIQDKGLLDDILRGNSQTTTASEAISQNFQAIENTIKAYTDYTLNAFKQVASANINKVTLEFGISIGGKAGIPYVTEGTANSSLKITVECSFDDN